MNAERLLAHYEQIADAPDAISRLRRFILELAVRGKLVPQNSKDETASQLVLRLSRQSTPHALKTSRTGTDQATDPAYALPSNWLWVRIGDHLDLLNGIAFKPSDWKQCGIKIVRIQNLNRLDAPFNYCDPKQVRDSSVIGDGSFLISWSGTPGTSFGAFIWNRGPAVLNQHIFRCDFRLNAFDQRFLRLAINGRLDEMIAKAHGGVGLQHITKGKLEALLIALPPLPEQVRIVAKVDKLMALCVRLEAARAEREAMRDQLAAASLARLNAPDPESFHDDVRFVLDALLSLTTRVDQIKQLRQTILNLAVRGKLVPQYTQDETAAELLERLAIAQNRSRRTTVECDVDPFPVPGNWQWATLGQVITCGPQNGISPKPTTRSDAPKAITLTATTSGIFNPLHFKRVDANIPADSDYWLREGDLLFQRGNTREHVGIAAIYKGPPGEFLFPDLIMKVRVSELINLRYVHLASVSPFARAYLSDNASGAQATMPKINQTTLLSLPIPMPPIAEQHRIVAKVDELMALCDRLEVSLATTEATRRRLLDAFLHEALHDGASILEERPIDTRKARSALSAYVVFRLAKKPSFGRTAHMKHLYLAEAHLGLKLNGKYIRQAAGPWDRGIHDLEEAATASGWYSVQTSTLRSGSEKIVYVPSNGLEGAAADGITAIGAQRAELDRVLQLLGDKKTEDVEIVATLFAAWNDALIDGRAPDDDWVIREVRENWHASKQRFDPAALQKWLVWMRDNSLVPTGKRPRTNHQASLDV